MKVSEAFPPREFTVWWEKAAACLLGTHLAPDTALAASVETDAVSAPCTEAAPGASVGRADRLCLSGQEKAQKKRHVKGNLEGPVPRVGKVGNLPAEGENLPAEGGRERVSREMVITSQVGAAERPRGQGVNR